MVTILFDKCAELWTGCPAVEAMDNGIETAEEIPSDGKPDESELGLLPFAANDPAREDSTGVTTSDENAKDAVEKTVDARRNLISKLKEKKKFQAYEENHNRKQNVNPWTRRTLVEKENDR